MRLLKIFILTLVMALPCVQAEQQVHCPEKQNPDLQIDKMIGFSEGMEKVQCDYVAKNECRYTKESCERSIGCAELIMKKGDLAKTQIFNIIIADEIRDYISVAFDVNLDSMKGVTEVMDYAKMLQIQIPNTCKSDYLTANESQSCVPQLLQNIIIVQEMPKEGDAPKAREYYDFTQKDGPDLRKGLAISNENNCNTDGFKDIEIHKNESSDHAKKRITALLEKDLCLKRFLTNVRKNDKSISLHGLIDQFGKQKNHKQNFGQFLATKTKSAVNDFLDVQCTAVPRMDDICANATKMQKGESAKIKDLYIPPAVLPFSKGVSSDLDSNLVKFKDIFQKMAAANNLQIATPEDAAFLRMFEAARCKVGKEKYEDDIKDCSEVNKVLNEAHSYAPTGVLAAPKAAAVAQVSFKEIRNCDGNDNSPECRKEGYNQTLAALKNNYAKECKKNQNSKKCLGIKKAMSVVEHEIAVAEYELAGQTQDPVTKPETRPATYDASLEASILSNFVNADTSGSAPTKPKISDSNTTISSTMVSGKLSPEQIALQKTDKKPAVDAPALTEATAPAAPTATAGKTASQVGSETTQRQVTGSDNNNNSGNNIPGTHPLATDGNGIPVPPPSSPFSPSYSPSASAYGDTQRQQTVGSPETQAIQKKLDDTQAKLDKLTAETEKAKAKADEEEKNALKEKIKKLEEEKAAVLEAQKARAQQAAQVAAAPTGSAAAQGQQPQLASGSTDSTMPQAQQQQSQQVSTAPVATQRSAAPAAKVASAGGASSAGGNSGSAGGAIGSAGAGLQIVVNKDYPAVDITDPNNIPDAVIRDYAEFAKSNKGDFKFNTKNGVFTLVPLLDDKTGAVVGYTAVKEKKAVVAAAKPASKPVAGPVPASVKPDESANRIRYTDMKKVIDSAK